MIIKEVQLELAGDTCNKVYCQRIITDTDPKENLILDAVKVVTVDDVEEDEVYYRDIAIALDDLPFELTEEEKEELRGGI